MNIPQMPSGHADRARWIKIAVAVWLLLVSALTIINSVGLSRLTEQSQTSAQDAQVQALANRIAELEQQVGAVKHQPKPVAQADFDATRQALDERLARVEQARNTDDYASEVQTLQARVGAIEERLNRATAEAVVPRRTAEPPKPKVPVPPFKVVGLELRGGERFLSVLAPGAATVRDVRLLHAGDTVGAWQLQSIEAQAAVFRVDGQVVRVAVP
jgi:outer membrane murein-binding lipoprotein Lpp